MDWSQIDWNALERLRTAFLNGSAGAADYWQSERDLASYDLTFAQRIGWKWDFVLKELTLREWKPPAGPLLDWGCGSGIAGRAYLDHFGADAASALLLSDRSSLAEVYAKAKAEVKYPGLRVHVDHDVSRAWETLLLSHVLTELTPEQLDRLLGLLRRSTAVLWIEPGTPETSRRLSEIRERLRTDFNVVAPCPHQGTCPMLAPQNAPHWCHHFASPPPEVFTDGNWARFGALAGIDLRSLPVSFLVLDKRPVDPLPVEAARVIGRPRVYKAHALLLGCMAHGLRDLRLSKRNLPEVFRRLKKTEQDSLQVWTTREDEIIEALPAAGRRSRPL